MLPQLIEIDKTVDRAEHLIGGDMFANRNW
jgi:hypothetical protein